MDQRANQPTKEPTNEWMKKKKKEKKLHLACPPICGPYSNLITDLNPEFS